MSDWQKIVIPAASVIIFIVVGSFLGYAITNSKPDIKFTRSKTTAANDAVVKVISVGDKNVPVELADTLSEIQLGLGGRKSLPKDSGLLFILPTKDVQPSFWMEGMQFSIDIIWINDGKVTQIDQNVPEPEEDTPSNELPLYKPFTEVDYVLEVNAGYVKNNGIAVGDTVDLTQIEN